MYKQLYTKLLFVLLIEPTIFLNYNTTDYTLYFRNFSDNGSKSTGNSAVETEATNYNGAEQSCVEPGYVKVCSGHGRCINAACECDSLRSEENSTEYLYEYTGHYCEECPYCKGQRCKEIFSCVDSILRNSTRNSRCYHHYKLVERIVLDYNDKFCYVEDSNRCMVKFKYFHGGDDVFVDIDKNVECLNGRNYIVFGWCVFIVYMVVLMIIFKVL